MSRQVGVETKEITVAQEAAQSFIKDEVFLVDGANRSALYDTSSGNVYSLNQHAADAIRSDDREDTSFWSGLEALNLIAGQPSSENRQTHEFKEIPPMGLDFAWLEITDDCNQRCLHCYGNFSPRYRTKTIDVFTYTEWLQTIEKLKAENCRRLQFIGGEPFSYKSEGAGKTVLDLAEFAVNTGFDTVEIFTNGTLIDENAAKRIKELGVHIAMSLYSANPKIHDTITRKPESYLRTMRTLDLLQKADVPIRLAVIVMKQNEEEIEGVLEMIKGRGLSAKSPDVVRPSGRAISKNLSPATDTLRKYGLMTKPNFATNPTDFWFRHKYNSCLAGKIAIAQDGKVLPCVFSRNEKVGDVKKQNLSDILHSGAADKFWQLSTDHILVCRDCEYRFACFDCRPLAEGANNGQGYLNAPNPRCTYNPYVGEWGNGVWRLNEKGTPVYKPIENLSF